MKAAVEEKASGVFGLGMPKGSATVHALAHAPQLRFAKPGLMRPSSPRLLHGPRDRDRSPVGFMPGFMPDKEFIKRSE